jgi:hypothetical protein
MVSARATVRVEESEGTTFSVMLLLYLETEPPETPSLFFRQCMASKDTMIRS